MAYNYNRNRYRQPSTENRLTDAYAAHDRTQKALDDALAQIRALEAEVARLERELANRG
jgi:hypothetical protein